MKKKVILERLKDDNPFIYSMKVVSVELGSLIVRMIIAKDVNNPR